ncbi:MAG: hypothetical protein ACTHNG_03385 [Ginsengibacter sp.]
MQKEEKLIEELESIQSFAEMLLEKCYSVRQLLTPGSINSRASVKKKSQSKINQVIANRNKSFSKKAKKLCCIFLLFSSSLTAQDVSLPSYDSVCDCIDNYYENLINAQTKEFQRQRKSRWLNYLPSPGYSPFTGGFSFTLNLSAPIQEARARRMATLKIQSITETYRLEAFQLKEEAKTDFKGLQNLIFDYHLMDSLDFLKLEAFTLVQHQYQRNEIAPSEFIARQIEYLNYRISRVSAMNAIKQKIFGLLLKYKCSVP